MPFARGLAYINFPFLKCPFLRRTAEAALRVEASYLISATSSPHTRGTEPVIHPIAALA